MSMSLGLETKQRTIPKIAGSKVSWQVASVYRYPHLVLNEGEVWYNSYVRAGWGFVCVNFGGKMVILAGDIPGPMLD